KAYCGAIDLNFSMEKLLANIQSYLDRGFNAVKIKVGQPTLDEDVERCSSAMVAALSEAGAEIVDVDVPEVAELSTLFAPLSACELIAVLGRERFLADRDKMDPVVAGRAALGLETTAETYIRLLWRHRELCRIMDQRMEGFDGWITPTRSTVPLPVTDYDTSEAGIKQASKTGLNTRPGNLFGFCGTSTPINALGSTLPVGFQVMCPALKEDRVLSIALALEDIVGTPPPPDLSAFL
ncbi:MAG: amidase family protein, partial [Rhodospirillales bacterium]|nr:amidase family protein [Rhodospirillales bacterium]